MFRFNIFTRWMYHPRVRHGEPGRARNDARRVPVDAGKPPRPEGVLLSRSLVQAYALVSAKRDWKIVFQEMWSLSRNLSKPAPIAVEAAAE
ncbi:hypothetical protein MPL3365_170264 [Mesorhizobium plurifarium]|uniref:Uncharacterized protein n=1 Tax=Mesorhizobium plurifarium TaxID=69974 RepID=A0A090FZP0_MESPL|nr:hypothetical protein MPL3365_170264 [Mesorhizobium plurifarium]